MLTNADLYYLAEELKKRGESSARLIAEVLSDEECIARLDNRNPDAVVLVSELHEVIEHAQLMIARLTALDQDPNTRQYRYS